MALLWTNNQGIGILNDTYIAWLDQCGRGRSTTLTEEKNPFCVIHFSTDQRACPRQTSLPSRLKPLLNVVLPLRWVPSKFCKPFSVRAVFFVFWDYNQAER